MPHMAQLNRRRGWSAAEGIQRRQGVAVWNAPLIVCLTSVQCSEGRKEK
jgi:hypothetical protein